MSGIAPQGVVELLFCIEMDRQARLDALSWGVGEAGRVPRLRSI